MLNQAVINLNTIRKNAKSVKGKLKTGVKLCAVVKADAYGHGLEKVSSALYSLADCFAVAIAEDGFSLRLSGIDKEVLILTPVADSEADKTVHYDFTHTCFKIEQIKMLSAIAKKQDKTANVHLKFNAGMNRFGVDTLKELKELLSFCKTQKHICVKGLYSHLSTPSDKNSLKTQVNKFLLAKNIVKGYNNKVVCHISASGGFLAGVQQDMVRVGLLLYGYKPFVSDLVSVKPAMKIYAPLMQKRNIFAGDTALYGDKLCTSKKELSLIRYGYADGLSRQEDCMLFNNRCMDVSAYTDIRLTKRGALVMDNAEEIARMHGTISYEILTKSAIKAEKIYLD